MDCPYCEQELLCHDWFGKGILSSNSLKMGYIYKCKNEKCDALEVTFYSLESEKHEVAHEGYPC